MTANDDTAATGGSAVGTHDQPGAPTLPPSGGEELPAPTAPTPPPARRPRSALAVALVLALALVAAAIGAGIGYAVHGTSSTPGTLPTPSTTIPSSTPKVSAIAAAVAPELVIIDTTLAYESLAAAGTGMVVTSSGRVITNNHVIAGATTITATDVGNGKTYKASVVGYDVSNDVAVLQLQGASGLRTVTFAKGSIRVGDEVVAIGNAGGAGTASAAAGVVTGLNQTITALSEISGVTEHLTGLIETNAAIQSGQSGGPLVNTADRVVGMVTAGSSNFAISDGSSQGYAVPAPTFRSIASNIVNGRESGTVHVGPTAFLGVRVTTVQQSGALVVEVVPTSPAAGAGVIPGDLITALAGQSVRGADTVASVLDAFHPGERIPVQLLDQAGQQRTVVALLVAGPPA